MEIPDSLPTKQAFSLLEEFKNFAFKGNVVDLAVGVIIGGAFGKIVSSMVDNVIMPLVGAVMPGDQGYKDWKLPIGNGVPVGLFLADVVSFLILAAALFFFIVKFLGWLMKSKAADAVEAAPEPTKEEKLLTEIRDLLKARA
jgi:large conductance mechanosensitive channel